MANRSYTGPNGLNPRMLRLQWCRDGEPQQWDEKIFLTGSEDSKFLLLIQPTIDASSGTVLSLTLSLLEAFLSVSQFYMHVACHRCTSLQKIVNSVCICNKSTHLET